METCISSRRTKIYSRCSKITTAEKKEAQFLEPLFLRKTPYLLKSSQSLPLVKKDYLVLFIMKGGIRQGHGILCNSFKYSPVNYD